MAEEKQAQKGQEKQAYCYVSRYPMVKGIKSGSVTYGPRNQKIPIPGIKFDFTNRVFTVTDELCKKNGWVDEAGKPLTAKVLHEEYVEKRPEYGQEFWLTSGPGHESTPEIDAKTKHVLKQEEKRTVGVTVGVESVTVKG